MTECMMKLQGKKVIWIGDVNVNQNSLSDLDYKKLDITMKLFGMIQTVTGITRVANLDGRITQSTIDVVITNCYSNFIECKVLDDRIGDHQALKCVLDFKVNKASKFQKVLIRDHSLNNLKALSYFLGSCSNYSNILSCTNVDHALDGLNHHIQESYDNYCPTKQIKCNSNFLCNPSKVLLAEIRKKKMLFRKYKKCLGQLNKFKCKCINGICKCRKSELHKKCSTSWDNYRYQRNYVTKLSKENRRTNIVQDLTVKSAKNDLKGIWKTIKHASNLPGKISSSSPSNLNVNGVNLHFATVGTIIQESIKENDSDDFLEYMPPPTECKLSVFEEVTVEQVKEYILSIPSDKSINDIMPIKVYKYIIPQIIEPVAHIINLSMKSGTMPLACKIASVTPILKTGDPNDPNNYRPISILPLLGKCIEYFVNQQLTDGFVIKWFKSYLGDRKQHTKIRGNISTSLPVKTGVPQGSILGPILFSLFINDLSRNCTQSTVYLFADDSALYFDNVSRSIYENVIKDMKIVYEWLRINKLRLNAAKSSFIVFDRYPNLDTLSIPLDLEKEYLLIEETKSQKYLGLMIDNLLNFQDHIDYVKSKIAKRIGALYRSKNLLPLKYRKMFVNALMLPQFDYLDIIWCRAAKTKLNSLDILYKKVAKIALDVHWQEPSVNVYRNMKWLPLHLRRQLHLSTYMYKILNEAAPSSFSGKFTYVSGGSRDAERCNLYIHKSRTHKTFTYLGAKCWNTIPENIRTIECSVKFSYCMKSKFMSDVIQGVSSYEINNSFDYFYTLAM